MDTLLDLDRLPTMEELRTFFKDHDWSATRVPVSWKMIYNPTTRKDEIAKEDVITDEKFISAKELFDDKFAEVAAEMGAKGIAGYGKDNPLVALQESTGNVIAENVLKLCENRPDYVDALLERYLSGENVNENADRFLHNAIEKMLQVMEFEALAEATKDSPAFEDFGTSSGNYRRQDYARKYYKTRSKTPITSLESEDDVVDTSVETLAISGDSAQINKEYTAEAVKAFFATLSDNDKQLLTFRMQGLTYEQIAEKMDFKTHSAVIKRRKKIEQAYRDFFKKYDAELLTE